jgi:hypothetical protein
MKIARDPAVAFEIPAKRVMPRVCAVPDAIASFRMRRSDSPGDLTVVSIPTDRGRD